MSPQTILEFLPMAEDVGIEVKLTSMGQSVIEDSFKFIKFDVPSLDKENDVSKISIKATIEFAQGNAVGIGNINALISELSYIDDPI